MFLFGCASDSLEHCLTCQPGCANIVYEHNLITAFVSKYTLKDSKRFYICEKVQENYVHLKYFNSNYNSKYSYTLHKIVVLNCTYIVSTIHKSVIKACRCLVCVQLVNNTLARNCYLTDVSLI